MGVLELHIPSECHGRLIGRGGATIKGLQEQFRVRLDIPRGGGTRVTLTGEDAAMAACQAKMEEILGFSVGSEPLAKTELKVDASSFGRLIGPGGSALRQLEQETGASVSIPPRGSGGPVVVEGQQQAVQNAIKAIFDLVGHVDILNSSVAMEAPHHEQIDLHTSRPINEALFFPERSEDAPNFERFLSYLTSAKKSMDVCVFTISDDSLSSAIIHAHAAGAKVRVITDDECASNQGSDIAAMRDAGITVVMDDSPAHMHHKFAILDGRVLINGSFNWTRGAATSNCENLTMTNATPLVRSFQEEFNRLWAQFSR